MRSRSVGEANRGGGAVDGSASSRDDDDVSAARGGSRRGSSAAAAAAAAATGVGENTTGSINDPNIASLFFSSSSFATAVAAFAAASAPASPSTANVARGTSLSLSGGAVPLAALSVRYIATVNSRSVNAPSTSASARSHIVFSVSFGSCAATSSGTTRPALTTASAATGSESAKSPL